MRKIGEYTKTFGIILGAALMVSGMNTAISSNTGAPSIATYSVTHELTDIIMSTFENTSEKIEAAQGLNSQRMAEYGNGVVRSGS